MPISRPEIFTMGVAAKIRIITVTGNTEINASFSFESKILNMFFLFRRGASYRRLYYSIIRTRKNQYLSPNSIQFIGKIRQNIFDQRLARRIYIIVRGICVAGVPRIDDIMRRARHIA